VKRFLSKRFVAGFLVVAVGGVFGGAYALWSSTGSGSGNASSLTAQNVSVAAVTGAADLYPGASGSVSFTLNNTNPYPVVFDAMEPGTVTSSNEVDCPASNVTVDGATGLNLAVGANSTSAPLSIANAVTMSELAPDGCQGIVFTIALDLTGSQA
jgi:hypothetical protein